MEIYAETLFIINFSAVFFCLGPACRVYGVPPRRQLAASAAGAFWALVIFAAGFCGAASKAAAAAGFVFTAAAAFGRKTRAWLLFGMLLLSVYAAVTIFISFFGSGIGAFIKNGVIYFNVPARIFVPVFAVILPLITAAERLKRAAAGIRRHRLKITKSGREADVLALFDSGNLLKDPRSGRRVILVSRNALKPLEPEKILTSEPPVIIPYRSLGHSGALLGFYPDSIILDSKKEINEAVIGISEERFAGDCDALIGGI